MKWWEIKAAAKPKTGEVRVYGLITSSGGGFFGSDDDVTPKAFADELKALGEVSEIDIYINSPGGDPFAATAIYSMLKRHAATKTVYIDGIAASAASLIAMVGDKVIMPSNTLMMIHEPAAGMYGTAEEHDRAAESLRVIAKSMAATYREKSGLEEAEILAIMAAETWYTAEEAVEKGFADEIESEKAVAASLVDNQAVINGQAVDISKFRNFPKDRFTSVVQAPSEAEKAAQALQARRDVLREKIRL
jgi:ATP-dependent protease ClpP protease subunit